MAPLSTFIAEAMFEINLKARHIGDKNVSTADMVWTKSQGKTLQCLALAFSVVSVASSILAFYWFIKMRRSFRHE